MLNHQRLGFAAGINDPSDDDPKRPAVFVSMRLDCLPQPRSSRIPAAATRAAAGTASWLTIPANTLTHSAVCPRASDRRSVGIFFRGNGVRGESTPPVVGVSAPLHAHI